VRERKACVNVNYAAGRKLSNFDAPNTFRRPFSRLLLAAKMFSY
jgi:hypothetical protein